MKIVMLERMSVGEDVDVSCFGRLGDFVWYEMVRPVPSGEFDGVESLRSRGLWPPVTGREVPRLFSV